MLKSDSLFHKRQALSTPPEPAQHDYGVNANHSAPKTHRPEESTARLLVGPNIKLKGVEITDCDTLIVEGNVEATMDSRVIQITPQGAFKGKAEIDVAEIHGRFEGELTARTRLIVHSTGQVSGKVRYGKLVIEEGGTLAGDIAATGMAENGRASLSVSEPKAVN
jgi:cytoskeletal protein CcmA (bactofilin family)